MLVFTLLTAFKDAWASMRDAITDVWAFCAASIKAVVPSCERNSTHSPCVRLVASHRMKEN